MARELPLTQAMSFNERGSCLAPGTENGRGHTELTTNPRPLSGKTPRKANPGLLEPAALNAGHFRQAVETAKAALAGAATAGTNALQTDLDQAILSRVQFWIDTCRAAKEMRVASPQVLNLHRHHGCRFWAPSSNQVQYILDALDSALPAWDRDHPELFYQTLELNFPDLLRAARHPSRHR